MIYYIFIINSFIIKDKIKSLFIVTKKITIYSNGVIRTIGMDNQIISIPAERSIA